MTRRARSAATSVDGAALIHDGQYLADQSLEATLARRVLALEAQGLAPGQVVMAPDTPVLDLVLMQHGLKRLGAALFPFRAGLNRSELRELARLTGAEWLFAPELGRLESTGFAAGPTQASASVAIRLLVKTSGSSGAPKVAMLTVDAIQASARGASARLGLGPGDLWLACLRLSHIGGLSIVYRCAMAGASMLLHDGFDAHAVGRDLLRYPVTHISLVPPMLARLLDLGVAPPPWLRVVLIGGQALSRPLAMRAVEQDWPLYVSYGMTETASLIAATRISAEGGMDPSIAGCLLEGVEAEARSCELDSTKPLRVRGPMLMAGYASPERGLGHGLEDGWYETADLACLRPDGQLRIRGRADDVLVIGGINVSLQLVHRAVVEAPGVRDCALVGLEDAAWGHRLAVAFSGQIDEAELERWCRENLPSPQRPRAFLRLPALPVLDSGKHDRRRIKAELMRLGR